MKACADVSTSMGTAAAEGWNPDPDPDAAGSRAAGGSGCSPVSTTA